VLENKFSKSFMNLDAARVKIAREESEIKLMEDELRAEEEKFKQDIRKKHRRRKTEVTNFMKKESEITRDNVTSSDNESSDSEEQDKLGKKVSQNTKKTEITEEQAEQLLNEYDDIKRLEAELFGEDIPRRPELEETLEERERRANLEAKRKDLEEKKIKTQQLEEIERKKILKEEAEVRKLEKELLQEESAFDRELEERRRKRQATDDYDWYDITEDPLASDSDEQVEDDETTRIVHDNK